MSDFWDARYKNPSVNRIAERWFIDYLPVFDRVKKEWKIIGATYSRKIITYQTETNKIRLEFQQLRSI